MLTLDLSVGDLADRGTGSYRFDFSDWSSRLGSDIRTPDDCGTGGVVRAKHTLSRLVQLFGTRVINHEANAYPAGTAT